MTLPSPREIRFRAWHHARQTMRHCNLYSDRQGVICRVQLEGDNNVIPARAVTLMQGTGYHDRMGRPIFEGDLLRLDDDDQQRCFLVCWGSFADCCVVGDTWILFPQVFMETVAYHADVSVVVGNYYEHTDLVPEEGVVDGG